MPKQYEFLGTAPFDLYELQLFRLVVEQRSFTRAAARAGLTQSAVTRQVRGVEAALGVELLERTTRHVRPTPAGAFLFRESARLLHGADLTWRRLREDYAGARRRLQLGVSSTIGLAYLPGFLHATLRRSPRVACQVVHRPGREILAAIESHALEAGIVCPPARLPLTLRATHQFEDDFSLIVPRDLAGAAAMATAKPTARGDWLRRQSWLLLTEASNTGRQLRAWMARQRWSVEPVMQLDNFDLIINLVTLGLGVSFVPNRALALYRQKQTWRQITLPERFSRRLAVVVRKARKLPAHLEQFIGDILF